MASLHTLNEAAVHFTRRDAVRRLAFFGAAMATLRGNARGQSNNEANPMNRGLQGKAAVPSGDNSEVVVKIARAMRAGPLEITQDATIAEIDSNGTVTVLRKGNNGWLCMPGNENRIGDPPMCVDELGMQWFRDILAGKPKPTNSAPGLCYMLCGATQHSNDNPFDRTSAAIPIGPHWMILWPFDSKHCGLPTTVRDAGAWIMFAGTPYAYLHVCGTPWDGNEYSAGDEAKWTMQYSRR